MNIPILAAAWLKELQDEAVASRKCLERIPADKLEFKPHPTSMNMGYLALLVAEIPMWITVMIDKGEIDFETFTHADVTDGQQLSAHLDANMAAALQALQSLTDDDAHKQFILKRGKQVLFETGLINYIEPTINHWVHHRGQLTIYMRMCEIPVPSVYGPSADDKQFG